LARGQRNLVPPAQVSQKPIDFLIDFSILHARHQLVARLMQKEIRSPDRFRGVERPSSLELCHIALSGGTAGRLKWQEDVGGVPVQMEQTDGYMVCYQRVYLPVRQEWVDGKRLANDPVAPGQFMLLDLRRDYRAISPLNVDCLSVFTSHDSLADFHREQGLPAFAGLRVALGATYTDPVMRNLMECLLPGFESPQTTPRLFLDQLMLTMLVHMSSVHASRPIELRSRRGGLAPWQERRVKELLLANLTGNIGLDRLAASCGVSRAHLARSFKASTGRSPMAWLQQQRLERASNLLLTSTLSVSEIAHRCGFADHSHFSKVFTRSYSVSPGEWRRARKM